jgi:hypothetical protein
MSDIKRFLEQGEKVLTLKEAIRKIQERGTKGQRDQILTHIGEFPNGLIAKTIEKRGTQEKAKTSVLKVK